MWEVRGLVSGWSKGKDVLESQSSSSEDKLGHQNRSRGTNTVYCSENELQKLFLCYFINIKTLNQD